MRMRIDQAVRIEGVDTFMEVGIGDRERKGRGTENRRLGW